MCGAVSAHARGSCNRVIPESGGVRCAAVGVWRIGDMIVSVSRHIKSGGDTAQVEPCIGDRDSCSGVLGSAP